MSLNFLAIVYPLLGGGGGVRTFEHPWYCVSPPRGGEKENLKIKGIFYPLLGEGGGVEGSLKSVVFLYALWWGG